MRILLGCPDQDRAGVSRALSTGGNVVDLAEPFDDMASVALHSGPYDAAIISVGRPGPRATSVLRDIRRRGLRLAVLFLVAEISADEESGLLNMGADDVLLRPTAGPLLTARLQATMRRAAGHASPVLVCGNVELDQTRQIVMVDGREARVTRREFDVLETLMLRRGMLLTKEHFMSRLYGDEEGPDQRILDVFVCKLRRKLAALGAAEIIRTVWGRGYAMQEPTPAEVAAARARFAAGQPRARRAHMAPSIEIGLAAI